jgi:hypothetical protein
MSIARLHRSRYNALDFARVSCTTENARRYKIEMHIVFENPGKLYATDRNKIHGSNPSWEGDSCSATQEILHL